MFSGLSLVKYLNETTVIILVEHVLQVPWMMLTRPPKLEGGSIGEAKGHKKKVSGGEDVLKCFLRIHESCNASPRRYLIFLSTYMAVYENKKKSILDKQHHLQVKNFFNLIYVNQVFGHILTQ